MPKGIPTPQSDADPRKLTITLLPEHYAALAQLAAEQYRTPSLQAAWLLAKILSDAGRVAAPAGTTVVGTTAPVAHATRILERARANADADLNGK